MNGNDDYAYAGASRFRCTYRYSNMRQHCTGIQKLDWIRRSTGNTKYNFHSIETCEKMNPYFELRRMNAYGNFAAIMMG